MFSFSAPKLIPCYVPALVARKEHVYSPCVAVVEHLVADGVLSFELAAGRDDVWLCGDANAAALSRHGACACHALLLRRQRFSEIIRKHKARYIYFPIVLTIATGLLFAFASSLVQAYILLMYWSWQAFHYGRQNLGIYSFVSIAQRGSAPSKYEKLVIDLGTWCGIIGTFKILGSGVAPGYLHKSFDTGCTGPAPSPSSA